MEAGADVNARNKYKETALHFAAERGFKDTVQILLLAGADPLLCNDSGKTALQLAIDGAHDGIVKILKKEADRRSIMQQAKQSQEKRGESVSDEKSSDELTSSTQLLTVQQTPAIAPAVEDASKELQHVTSQSQVCNCMAIAAHARLLSGSTNKISKERRGSVTTANANQSRARRFSDVRFRFFLHV